MKTILLILALISFNVEARLIKSEPTLETVTYCVQRINRINFLVISEALTPKQAEMKTKGCNASINRYDATELASRQWLAASIRALIK